MNNLKKLAATGLAVLALALTSCNDKDSDNNDDGMARIRVSLTDAPADFDEVNIEVIDVKIKNSSDSGENGWVSIGNVTPAVYNLLDLTGGVTVMLADNEIPAGYLGQIRLILGDDNTVVRDGVTYPLNTPSAQQSGLKVHVNETLLPDVTYNFLVDFDAHQSVVMAGNSGNYNLHPVLHVSAEAASGSITGTVAPTGYPVMATVNIGSQTINAYTNSAGVFVLHGIPSGVYTVMITTDQAAGLSPLVIQDVSVVNGQPTNMGNLSL